MKRPVSYLSSKAGVREDEGDMIPVDYGISIPFISAKTTETDDLNYALVDSPPKAKATSFEASCPSGLVNVCSPSGTDDIVWRYAG